MIHALFFSAGNNPPSWYKAIRFFISYFGNRTPAMVSGDSGMAEAIWKI